jgi:pyruvate/2-oxoglutarate dehydrogenase complex dihydrolipoamide dehydrogenase (E3) component
MNTTFIVIGSGPAGQKGAVGAAKAHNRVAVIDRTTTIGGVCVHTGTISSKTLREGNSSTSHSTVHKSRWLSPIPPNASTVEAKSTASTLVISTTAGFQAHGGSRRGTLHGGSTLPETVIVSD